MAFILAAWAAAPAAADPLVIFISFFAKYTFQN